MKNNSEPDITGVFIIMFGLAVACLLKGIILCLIYGYHGTKDDIPVNQFLITGIISTIVLFPWGMIAFKKKTK